MIKWPRPRITLLTNSRLNGASGWCAGSKTDYSVLRRLPSNRFGSRVFSVRCCNTRNVFRTISDKLQTVLFYWWWNLEFLPGRWRGQGIPANSFSKLLRPILTRTHAVGTWSRDKVLRVYVKDAWCRDWKQACTHSVIGSFQWCRENSLQEHCTRWTL